MVETSAKRAPHVFIFEPRIEGHHLGYLKVITEELLDAGYRLTLAVDKTPEAYAVIRAEMSRSLERASVIPAKDGPNGGSNLVRRIATLFEESKADLVFLPNLDEIGSVMLRSAAFGMMPPAKLHGRLGGIYHRPRFLGDLGLSPNLRFKSAGFRRLLRGGWFSHLLLVDPYLQARLKTREPDAPAFFLPDFFPSDFSADRAAARRQFDLPAGKRVFLFYGLGRRRKGLGLTVQAMLAMSAAAPAFLLCAGRQAADRKVARGLERLEQQGRARVINRYVSSDEEKQLFAASDVVLLPYRRHFPISGVLVRAIGAGLPVIASDEGLIGRLVREHTLGILFRSGDARTLQQAIETAAQAPQEQMARWQAAAHAAAPNWTKQAFCGALDTSFNYAVSRLSTGLGAG